MKQLLVCLVSVFLFGCPSLPEIEKPAASTEELRKDGTKVTSVRQLEIALAEFMVKMEESKRHKIECTAACKVDLYAGTGTPVNLMPAPKPVQKHPFAQGIDSLSTLATSIVLPLVGGDVLKTSYTSIANLGMTLGRSIQAPAGTSIVVDASGSQGSSILGGSGSFTRSDTRTRTNSVVDNSQDWQLSILCTFYANGAGPIPAYCNQR